jgi:hypothetical protein
MDTAPDIHQLGCEDVEPLLPLAADGAIDVSSDPAVFAHLARCSECQASLARHDLITIALECGRSQVPAPVERGWHYRLPWPAAVAALVAVAVLVGWAADRPLAPSPALAAAAPDFQVLEVTDSKLGHPLYVVSRDGKVMIIDPQAVDGASSSDVRELHPVVDKLSTH